MFEDPSFIEVFRTFVVHLQVTGTTPNPAFPSRPTIQFKGTIHDVHNMRGEVAIGCDNTVRWIFVRIRSYDDEVTGIDIGKMNSRPGTMVK